MDINLEGHPRRKEQVLEQSTASALFLFDLNRGEFYTLNDVGERAWQLCDGSRSVSEIISILCQEFDAPRKMIEADIFELLADLVGEGLLEDAEQVAKTSLATAEFC